MPLTYVRELNANFDRQLFRFMASTGEEEVVCAVTYTALDDEDRATGTTPVQRPQQFLRHKDRIMEAASRRFYAGLVDYSADPVVLVKRDDLAAVPRGA
jgi:hypothetical protein